MGTTLSGLIHVQLESSGEEKGAGVQEKHLEKGWLQILQHLMKTINTPPQEARRLPSTRNVKKTTSRLAMIKFLKTSDKKRILKAARKKKMHYLWRNKDDDDRFLIENNASEKTVGQHLQNTERKEL